MMHRPNAERTGTRLLLTVLVLMGAVSLSACSDADWDLLASLAEDWAYSNGVFDGEGFNMANFARLGVEEQINALIDGRPASLDTPSVVDDLRMAENLVNQGARMGGPQGLKSIEEAIALRPRDWGLWEQKGALLMAEGKTQEAEDAFSTSTALARSQLASGGDCKLYQRNLLNQREQALLTQINIDYENNRTPPDDLIDRLDRVQGELALLETPAGLCG